MISEFLFLDSIFEACIEFQEKGYLIIVITNQGGIAKGMYTHRDVENLHKHMLSVFTEHGIKITEVYYCPHHNAIGNCLCRKPGSLLVEKAIARFNIDPAASWFIGDRERDILAGEGAGVKGILVNSNVGLSRVKSLID
jgi:D-glycero-D-manno-heptose 1,7-bisphosphate phosphatase